MTKTLQCLLLVTVGTWVVQAFPVLPLPKMTHTLARAGTRKTLVIDKAETTITGIFDPFDIGSNDDFLLVSASTRKNHHDQMTAVPSSSDNNGSNLVEKGVLTMSTVATPWAMWSQSAAAASGPSSIFSQGDLDPASFQPVCPASDGLYRFLQSSTAAVVGPESFVEYGPLIAGGLLRVRLELCVVESFIEEAVVPFIQRNGLSWVLPLHETVETFIAGTIFAVSATFILIGSTKLVGVIVFFTDFLLGAPARLLGGFVYDRARGKPVTLDLGFGPFKTRVIGPPEEDIQTVDTKDKSTTDIVVIGLSGVVKYTGDALKVIRQTFDAIDLFVGRYLVIWATGYILLKFVHYKIFPDFP